LAGKLIEQFKACFPPGLKQDSSMFVPTATIDLRKQNESLLPAVLTTTQPLEIKWKTK
jgi:hypothetical protein